MYGPRNRCVPEAGDQRCQVSRGEGEECRDEVESDVVEHGLKLNDRTALGLTERWTGMYPLLRLWL